MLSALDFCGGSQCFTLHSPPDGRPVGTDISERLYFVCLHNLSYLHIFPLTMLLQLNPIAISLGVSVVPDVGDAPLLRGSVSIVSDQ